MKRGFTLVESLIATAIFALLAGVIYQTSALLIRTVGVYRENVTISSLANEYMEIVHNLPYSSVGTMSGVPHGSLPDEPNASTTPINGTDYKIYYYVKLIDDPADGLAGDSDNAPEDYKQVKLFVKNIKTDKTYSFLTDITPKGLEGMSSGGALAISVIDSSGNPVPNAVVNISNPAVNIDLPNRTTDADGKLTEVGLTPSANSYRISVTKSDYSTDRTYPVTLENPNPTKPDWTVSTGLVSPVSFIIDKLSDLSFDTLDLSCQPLSGIDMRLQGEKTIGETPEILKFDNNYTSNGSGRIVLNNIEPDNYTPTINETNYVVYGSSPIQEVSVLPDTTQNFTLLLGPKHDNSLLVVVKDLSTKNPVEDATVTLQSSSANFDESKITGGSVWSTASWTPVPAVDNLNTDIIPYALRLLSFDNGDHYVPSGTLISDVFDTGTASTTYSTLTWQPVSQPLSTEVKFQIATSDTNSATTTWNFLGPGGADTAFYSTSGNAIDSPAGRYVRYKVLMSTVDGTKSPTLTSVNVNYVSGCFTPGQVFFPDLETESDYELVIEADGYTTQTVPNLNIAGYNVYEVNLQ